MNNRQLEMIEYMIEEVRNYTPKMIYSEVEEKSPLSMIPIRKKTGEPTKESKKETSKALASLVFLAIITRLELFDLLVETYDTKIIFLNHNFKKSTTIEEAKELFKFIDLDELEEIYIQTPLDLGKKPDYGIFLAIKKSLEATTTNIQQSRMKTGFLLAPKRNLFSYMNYATKTS